MIDAIPVASYGSCALVYFGLGLATVLRGSLRVWRWPVLAAFVATCLWALLVLGALTGSLPTLPALLMEMIRDVCWFHLLLTLLGRIDTGDMARQNLASVSWLLLPGLAAIVIVITIANLPWRWPLQGVLIMFAQMLPVIMPVLGLLILENLFRNSGPSGRWGLKYLCLGLSSVFAFDLTLYSDQLVLGALNQDFMSARGFTVTLAALPIAISLFRMKSWTRSRDIALNVSHHVVFFTTALAVSGLYLLTMAITAFYIRETGGIWGPTLQITFMIGGLVLLFAVFASETLRSRAKETIQKHFFSYKYDYRKEWLRFIEVMSFHQSLKLGERLVRTMADMMNCPAGALWVWQRADSAFMPDAAWNYRGLRPSIDQTAPLIEFLGRTGWILELEDTRVAPDRYPGLVLPDWITDHATGWIVIPLTHRTRILGFIILDQARAPRRLDWEDRDLLKTTAAQGASYLAEEMAADALSDAQRFEEFNRRFAFVVHDIKNVIGQMSLIVDNARRFGDNPEFQKDMMETVQNSVTRMKALLEQLADKRRQSQPEIATIDIKKVLEDVAERWRKTKPSLISRLPSGALEACAVRETLVSVLDLLIDNAFAVAVGPVILQAQAEGANVVIEVQDDGPGMDQSFVNSELFQPMRSTKAAGYGIGAYQSRYLIREMGGRLEVNSAPGRGTSMRILLPSSSRPRS